MLWKRGWWETRLLFLAGLVGIFLAYGLTSGGLGYDEAKWAASLQSLVNLSESERQALNNYQGRTWAVGFNLILNLSCANLALMLGTVCLVTTCRNAPSQYAAGFFTCSLPVSRRKVLLSQAAVGFGELVLIALSPSLLSPIIASLHGKWFSWGDTLIYTLLMIFGGAVFFCSAVLLTVILENWLLVFVVMEAVVFALFLPFGLFGERPWWNPLRVMAGESYFFHGRIPWLGLLITLTLSAVFMYAAIRIYERRDL
ncbi:MAG TPA: ABC-2 transporter permease [Blastocatellia bacterium]|nr:ABC-2 transporter permease [Blastocatellia bacterium]